MTTGVGNAISRSRSADPRAQASEVVKCSNFREASIRDIESSCGMLIVETSDIDV